MTLASDVSKSGPYDGDDPGDGSSNTVSYSYHFKVTDPSHLIVTLTDKDGIESPLTDGTNYRLAGVGNNNGGTVYYPIDPDNDTTRLKIGEKLTLRRVVPLTQLTDITTGGRFDPRVHEDVFDLATMGLQQLNEQLSRTIRLSVSDGSGADLILPPPEAKKLLGWSEAPFRLINYGVSGSTDITLAQIGVEGAELYDLIHFDGSELVFTDTITVTGTLFAGPSVTPVQLTNPDGTIKGAAIEETIAGAGLTIESGIMRTDTAGQGGVGGPGPTVTEDSIAIFDGAGGLLIKSTGVTINATDDIWGVNSLTASDQIHLLGPNPQYLLSETDATVDNKHWTMQTNGETLKFAMFGDGFISNQSWLEVDRTQMTVDTMTFPQGDVFITAGSIGIQRPTPATPMYMLEMGSQSILYDQWTGGADGIIVAETGDVKIYVQGESAAGINLIATQNDDNDNPEIAVGQVESDNGSLVLRGVTTPPNATNKNILRLDLATQKAHFSDQNPVIDLSQAPVTSGSTDGEIGEIAWDANGIYVYVSDPIGWRKATLSSF